MTTRFTQDELMQMRAVKKSAAILFIVALFDRKYPGRAYKVADIAADLDMDKRTVDAACKSLSAGGSLLFDGIGYVLTAGGRGMLLGTDLAGGTTSIETTKALALTTQAQAHPALDVLELTAEDVPAAAPTAKNVQTAADDAQNVHMHKMCTLEEEDRLINTPDTNSSLLSSDAKNVHAQNAQAARLTVRSLFEAADGMDGFQDGADQYLGRMISKGVNPETLSARLGISWMAHAYDQRSRDGRRYGIQSPGWFVVSKLTDPSNPKPGRQYWEHPRDFLPDGFLAAVGLPRAYDCQVCGEKFTDRESLSAHLSERHPVEVEPVTAQPLEGWTERAVIGAAATVKVERLSEPTVGAADVWREVVRTLEAEMPPASFQTWVADTTAGELRDSQFTVVTRNAFARDWLESRLTTTVTRILCGLLGQDVTVRFVVRNHEEG